jgi:hypothetical protein
LLGSLFAYQVKLPFEKLIHALKNFPEDAMNPDTLLPLAYSIKVLFLPLPFNLFSLAQTQKNLFSPLAMKHKHRTRH